MKKQIKNALELIKDCFEQAPVDFLGTGSDSKFAAKEEKLWNETWQSALKDIEKHIKESTKEIARLKKSTRGV